MRVFQDGKPFFKGNLHCHTTLSDGCVTPERAAEIYREHGYDFLAITDHRRVSPPSHSERGMLLLSGIELDYCLASEVVHIIGVGVTHAVEENYRKHLDPQHGVNLIREHGGRAILAHPAWSLNTMNTLLALNGVTAAEIYNATSTYPWNCDRADSSAILDVTATHGKLYNVVASDDSHNYDGDACVGATIVQAEELSEQAIFAALDAGRFYASCGPRFEQIELTDGYLSISCSPVQWAVFYSNLPYVAVRALKGNGMTEAGYPVQTRLGERYVRCQIIDENGHSAWSNPLPLQ